MVEARGSRRIAILVFAAAFGVLLFGRWLKPVDSVAVTVAAPFASVINGAATTIGDTVSAVIQAPRIRDENQRLRQEIAVLLRDNQRAQEALHQNQYYARLFKFDDLNKQLTFLTARVIANDPNAPQQYVVINRGSRDGLEPGMTVVSQDTYFLGSIIQVTPTAAKVQLMTSPSSSVGAYDMQSRAKGVVNGNIDGLPQMQDVVTSAQLKVGDFIFTSGDANIFPRGILLGQIHAVRHNNVDVLQSADLVPATDFGNMELVQVIKNFKPSVPVKLLRGP
jgi:rod shape-determining protein MreC